MSDHPTLTHEILREFVEKAPLYSRRYVSLPPFAGGWPKSLRIEFYCPRCKQSRPFGTRDSSGAGAGMGPHTDPPLSSGVRTVRCWCKGCEKTDFDCWIEVNVEESWIRKVGQCPPHLVHVNRRLSKALGRDAEFYERAMRCLTFGFGLGACIYLRRVIEDHANDVLRLVREEIAATHPESSDLPALDELVDGKADFLTKIEEAAKRAPESIRHGTHNPLKVMFDHVSVAVHRLSEEEAVAVARNLKEAFEFVMVELKRRHAANRRLVDAMNAALPGKPRKGN